MSRLLRYKELLIICSISIILPAIWFHSGLIKGGGEEGLAFYHPLKTYQLSQIIWWDYNTGFPTLAWLPHSNTFFILAFFSQTLHIASGLLQAATYSILLITGGFAMYFLVKEFLSKQNTDSKIPLIASLFYILNPYSMTQIWGRGLTPQFFTFALLPLAILFFLKGLKKKNYIYVVFLTLCSVVFSSAFGITTFVLVYWSVLAIVGVYQFVITPKKTFTTILFYIFYFSLALGLWILANAHWFLPTVVTGNKIYADFIGNPQENIGTLLGVSRNFTPLVLIRLLQDTYFFAPSALSVLYTSFPLQLISWLLPLFLFIGLYCLLKKREWKQFRLFGWLFLTGWIVSSGANPPFGWLFVLIFERVGVLQSFRNPYEKFGIVYALGYAVIVAIGILYFWSKFTNTRVRIIGLSITLCLLCGVFLFPMWTGRSVVDPDRKAGMTVPAYYPALNQWLHTYSGTYRVAFTPIWAGDGAFYQWGSSQYIGTDPMMYLLDTPVVSSSPSTFPYFSDVMKSIRNNIYRLDISGALSLLRTKYLVGRRDAVNASLSEQRHEYYVTDTIYPPQGITDETKVLCKDMKTLPGGTSISCQLKGTDRNLEKVKYLHVVMQVDQAANIDIALRDTNMHRPRWYGVTKDEYFLPAKQWTTITLPLGTPTEVNNATDFSHIELIEIQAHPLSRFAESVTNIQLQGMWLDEGKPTKVANYKKIVTFGKLHVYEPRHLTTPAEFGILDTVETIHTVDELLIKSSQQKDTLDKHGFLLVSQNKKKNLTPLQTAKPLVITDTQAITNKTYWLEFEKSGNGLVILSKMFSPQWKVIPNTKKEEVQGGFWNDIKLLKKTMIPEKDHYVVNGYANLWKLSQKTESVAIVFLPQLWANIGEKISLWTLRLLVLLIFLYVIAKRYR